MREEERTKSGNVLALNIGLLGIWRLGFRNQKSVKNKLSFRLFKNVQMQGPRSPEE
jgi:hypothetical protein